MNPEEEIRRADKAKQILDNSLFKEAVREVKDALVDGIERSAFADEKLREKLCQQLVALTAVVGKLKSHMETGRMAEEAIKQERSFMERMKEFVN